jgi:hypothetical protein
MFRTTLIEQICLWNEFHEIYSDLIIFIRLALDFDLISIFKSILLTVRVVQYHL